MKKCTKAFSLLLSVAALSSMTSCGEAPVTSKANTLLSYTNKDGVSVDFTTDELLLNYFDSDVKTSNEQVYSIAYEALVRKFFSLDENKTLLEEVKTSADNEIRKQKNTAEENAQSNQTKFEEEWNKILDSELSDYKENKRTEDLLREKYEYKYMKTKIADEFYDKFKDWKDTSTIEDVKEKALQEKYNIFSGENGYLEKRLPYHVRHILVKVDASQNALYNGQISASDAESLYNVVDALAKGESFGAVAEDHSEDSAESYGNLGIMDKSTSFVNEFKLGIYTYDTLFNKNTGINASLSQNSNPFNMVPANGNTEYKDYLSELGVATIPVGAVSNIYKYKDVTTNKDGKEVNEGLANYYPRNILFNKYFNNHNIALITNNSSSTKTLIQLDSTKGTTTNGNTYYSDLTDGKWDIGTSAGTGYTTISTAEHKSGFKTIELKNGQTVECLCDENSNPILVVRAGTSDYQGIHFITIERSALEKTKTYTYYNKMGQADKTYESTLNEYYAAISPITLANSLNSEFPTFTDNSGNAVAKKSYINYTVTDYNSYADRANTLKNTIKDFNPSYDNYLYLWLVETANASSTTDIVINVAGSSVNVTERINKYVYQQIEKNKSTFDISEETWKEYVEYLKNQETERSTKLIPEACALGYWTGKGYEDGGICKYVKKAQ